VTPLLVCPGTSLKGEKHFIYIQNGCEKQSKVVNSLNYDIMASFTHVSDTDPELPKI